MTRPARALLAAAAVLPLVPAGQPANAASVPAPISAVWRQWANGPNPTGDPRIWPIGVWEQNPGNSEAGRSNAANYRGLGVTTDINSYGDTAAAQAAGWQTWQYPGDQYEHIADPGPATAWQMGDEPDMLPTATWARPSTLLHNVDAVRAKDPTRPVHVNYGKAMSLDHWYGYVPEADYDTDMATYCRAADIVSGDYYAFSDDNERWQHYVGAWTYGRTITNIHRRCGATKPALAVVETAELNGHHITADQIEQAAWSIAVHGADGIIWFAHAFDPNGAYIAEDQLLRDPLVAARIAQIDATFTALAPVLNTADTPGVSVVATGGVPMAYRYVHQGGHSWLLAQADGDYTHNDSGATTAAFHLPDVLFGTATALGEDRTVPVRGGRIVDAFAPYGHHVYRIN